MNSQLPNTKDQEPKDEFTNLDGATLQDLLSQMKDKLKEVLTKRNYVQNDRDMIQNFYNNTQKDTNELKLKGFNLDTEIETLEKHQRAEVNTYLHKANNLELDQKIFIQKANRNEKLALIEEEAYQNNWSEAFKSNKHELKQCIAKDGQNQQFEAKSRINTDQKRFDKTRENFEQKLQGLIQEQEIRFAKAKEELELKMKVEIHKADEKKNLHINELMANHEKAFVELKSYYNEITGENLKLIQAEKNEIEGVQSSLVRHKKLLEAVRSENRIHQSFLEEATKKRDKLEIELSQQEKDKIALADLKNKHLALNSKISNPKKSQDDLCKRFAQAKREKEQLEVKLDKITREVKEHKETKNIILSGRLLTLQNQLDQKEEQLKELIKKSSRGSSEIDRLLSNIRTSIESKNAIIRNLKYSIHHATKAYDDTIRVCEAKLTEFGIPNEKLGLQKLELTTSTIPAGLVAS